MPAFILPAGFRPVYNIAQAAAAYDTYGTLYLAMDGRVTPAGNNGWFSLDGITFKAA
jgi:hypothetical protein